MRQLPEDGKRYGLALREGDHIVEPVADREQPNEKVYYTLHKIGCDDVLSIGSEPTFDLALRSARAMLDEAAL